MAWQAAKENSLKTNLILVACSIAWIVLLMLGAHWLDWTEPFLPLTVAGGFVFFLRLSPDLLEMFGWLIASASFIMVARFSVGDLFLEGSCVLALFGLGAFLMIGLRCIWSEEKARRQAYAVLAPALGLVFFVFSAQHALNLGSLLHPKTFDLYLFAVDGSFGFQPSFLLGQLLATFHSLNVVVTFAYLVLPFVMAVACALYVPIGAERPTWDIITLLLLAGLGGWALYNLVPGAGPAAVFGRNFPMHPLSYHALQRLNLERILVPTDAPLDAIPSLHIAWVVLLLWNTASAQRVFRVFLWIFLILTVISTMGTGQHYLTDLITGVPYALMIQAIVAPANSARFSRRLPVICMAGALTLGWMFLVRTGATWLLVSPIVPWSLTAGTIAAVWALRYRLATCGDTDVMLAERTVAQESLSN